MKRMVSLLAMASVAVAPAAQAQDDAGAPYKLVGQWAVDFGDDYCRLAGNFSNGDDAIALAMERTQPGAQLRLMVGGDGIKTFRRASEIGYHFQPSGAKWKSAYFRSSGGAAGASYIFLDGLTLAAFTPPAPGTPPGPPPLYDRQQEQVTAGGITAIALNEGLTNPVRIETGSLRQPIAVLQQCADDLLKTWGLDADKHKTLTVAVTPNPAPDGFLPTGTIPFSQFSNLSAGRNQVRLMIDATGKPTSCTIHSPSLSESLNNTICRLLMERASYQPAKDASGEAIASYWFGSPMFLGPPFAGARR